MPRNGVSGTVRAAAEAACVGGGVEVLGRRRWGGRVAAPAGAAPLAAFRQQCVLMPAKRPSSRVECSEGELRRCGAATPRRSGCERGWSRGSPEPEQAGPGIRIGDEIRREANKPLSGVNQVQGW